MRRMTTGRLAPALALVIGLPLLGAVAGCGGDDGASCDGTAPCGGEITAGRYKISAYCASGSGTVKSAACPAGISVSFNGLSVAGSYTFNADKTYRTEGTLTGSIMQTFPAECLTMRGVTLSCAQLNQAVQAALQDPDSPFSAFTCSGGGSCTCTATFKPQPTRQSGSWSTSGTNLTLIPDGASETVVAPYCATGSQITLSAMAMEMPAMNEVGDLTGNLKSSMVLTRE